MNYSARVVFFTLLLFGFTDLNASPSAAVMKQNEVVSPDQRDDVLIAVSKRPHLKGRGKGSHLQTQRCDATTGLMGRKVHALERLFFDIFYFLRLTARVEM